MSQTHKLSVGDTVFIEVPSYRFNGTPTIYEGKVVKIGRVYYDIDCPGGQYSAKFTAKINKKTLKSSDDNYAQTLWLNENDFHKYIQISALKKHLHTVKIRPEMLTDEEVVELSEFYKRVSSRLEVDKKES